MPKNHSKLKITGVFKCKVFEHGKLIKEYTGNNLVVTKAFEKLAQFLATNVCPPISKIQFGSGTGTPLLGNTALTAPVFTNSIISAVNPTVGTVEYTWALGLTEANGITITEFGLLFDDMDLFARKTGLTVAKTSSISLTGTWEITISS